MGRRERPEGGVQDAAGAVDRAGGVVLDVVQPAGDAPERGDHDGEHRERGQRVGVEPRGRAAASGRRRLPRRRRARGTRPTWPRTTRARSAVRGRDGSGVHAAPGGARSRRAGARRHRRSPRRASTWRAARRRRVPRGSSPRRAGTGSTSPRSEPGGRRGRPGRRAPSDCVRRPRRPRRGARTPPTHAGEGAAHASSSNHTPGPFQPEAGHGPHRNHPNRMTRAAPPGAYRPSR